MPCNLPSADTARAMSQENVEVVKRAVAAVNDRDVEGYLACCTADVRMENSVTPIEGAYEGSDGIRRARAMSQEQLPAALTCCGRPG